MSKAGGPGEAAAIQIPLRSFPLPCSIPRYLKLVFNRLFMALCLAVMSSASAQRHGAVRVRMIGGQSFSDSQGLKAIKGFPRGAGYRLPIPSTEEVFFIGRKRRRLSAGEGEGGDRRSPWGFAIPWDRSMVGASSTRSSFLGAVGRQTSMGLTFPRGGKGGACKLDRGGRGADNLGIARGSGVVGMRIGSTREVKGGFSWWWRAHRGGACPPSAS